MTLLKLRLESVCKHRRQFSVGYKIIIVTLSVYKRLLVLVHILKTFEGLDYFQSIKYFSCVKFLNEVLTLGHLVHGPLKFFVTILSLLLLIIFTLVICL